VTGHPLLIKIEFCTSQKIVSSTSILAGWCLITLYYGYVLHVVCYMWRSPLSFSADNIGYILQIYLDYNQVTSTTSKS
jgi:hypothetical protein